MDGTPTFISNLTKKFGGSGKDLPPYKTEGISNLSMIQNTDDAEVISFEEMKMYLFEWECFFTLTNKPLKMWMHIRSG